MFCCVLFSYNSKMNFVSMVVNCSIRLVCEEMNLLFFLAGFSILFTSDFFSPTLSSVLISFMLVEFARHFLVYASITYLFSKAVKFIFYFGL